MAEVTVGDSGLIPATEAPKEMMSLVLGADEEMTEVQVNFSSLALMQECWQKTNLQLVRGLRGQYESPATLFGSAIHKALETYYLAARTKRNLPAGFTKTLETIGTGYWDPAWEEETVFLAARNFCLRGEALSVLPPENKHSLVTGAWLLRHYFERYLGDPYVVFRDDKGPVVERTFRFTLTHMLVNGRQIKITVFGTIDVVLINEATQHVLPCDHKTTGQIHTFYDRVKPNHQYTCYIMGAQRCLGLPGEEFLVNAIEKKVVPKTARGGPPQFPRQITNRTADDFREFEEAVVHSVYQFLFLKGAGHWPLSAPGPCSSYGGCEYLDVCAAPRELRENVIRAKYTENGWRCEPS